MEYGPQVKFLWWGSIFYREYGPGSIFHGVHILYDTDSSLIHKERRTTKIREILPLWPSDDCV